MIYLDNAATTRVRPEVRAAMDPFLDRDYGNPSSLHAAGRRARRALEDARETAAAVLGADPKEIVFTSGATESNALAIAGVAEAHGGGHLVTTTIEHPSVLAAFERLEKQGWKVTRVPVDSAGLVDPARVAAAVTPKTALVSVMLVNNEVGSIQPLPAIRRAAPNVVIHTDAAQAVGKVPVNLQDADLVSFSAHKIHGPKGVGGLWIRKGTPIAPQLVGGGQEFEKRAGTENVAGAVGLAAALKLAGPGRMAELRERLRRGLGAPADARAPHILNVAFDGVDGEAAILALDAAGVCISSGSACASGSTKPSHVLTAMGLPPDVVKSSVRFSLSMMTTDEDIDGALRIVPGVVERLRKISPVSR
jgi:cysteine desulfurase